MGRGGGKERDRRENKADKAFNDVMRLQANDKETKEEEEGEEKEAKEEEAEEEEGEEKVKGGWRLGHIRKRREERREGISEVKRRELLEGEREARCRGEVEEEEEV